MKESAYQDLCRLRLERELSEAEWRRLEALVAETPALREDWEAEQLLDAAWAHLPRPSASPGFADRVVRRLERDLQPRRRRWRRFRIAWPDWKWAGWQAALGSLAVLCLIVWGGLTYQHHQEHQRQVESLAAVSEAAEWVDVRTLRDFEAIEKMAQVSFEPDTELLGLLE